MQDIELAALLLKQGKLVAFPTETVYGLGASAFNPKALRKVFEAKG
jgi:L-threonylcarbamoyladenylate synthase